MRGTGSPAWRRWLPGLAQVLPPAPGAWRADAVAGTSVAIVMIPSVLAYAELVGLAPSTGLYAAIGSMALYALFTQSRRVIVGPDTTIALLAAAVIAPLAAGDPARAAALAALLAIMTGAVLVAAARLGIGQVADVLAQPVLVGYANGAALVLIASQLAALLGVSVPNNTFLPRMIDVAAALPRAHVPTLALGVALIALLLALRAWRPRVPGPLVACVVAVAAMIALGLRERGVETLSGIATGLPAPALPDTSFADVRALAGGAIALAFLVFAEGVLLARTLAERHDESVDPGVELRALGAANVGAGLLGGFNVGASGSRSITADAAGGRTQGTQFATLALLVAFTAFLAPLLEWLPRVALAAILIVAALNLLDVAGIRTLRRLDRHAFWIAILVTVGVLLLGVLPGMLIGVALAFLEVLVEVARPRDAVLRRSPGDGRFHDLDDDVPGVSPPGVIVYRLYAPLVFANAHHVAERLKSLAGTADPPARLVVLDLQAVWEIDVTAAQVLSDLHVHFALSGIDLRFARANRPLREQMDRMLDGHGASRERFFPSASAAVDDFLASETAGRHDAGAHAAPTRKSRP
ncbi:putative sulfate transporter [Burkholderiales bacterium]|nr:putative sulfate transporter [Burkholderiales bacterium]